ncbi:hypothetical protein [Thiothrix unzii]|nr:hypothetical protein [Thiothrix unzii]
MPRDSITFFVARTAIMDCEGMLTYFNLPTDQVVEIGTQVTL